MIRRASWRRWGDGSLLCSLTCPATSRSRDTRGTVITGFMFPISALTPAPVVGGVSLIALAIAYHALHRRGERRWAGRAYTAGGIVVLYLNLFVLVAQGFAKVAFLNRLAPTQSELPFAAAQLLLLIGSVALGLYAMLGMRRPPPQSPWFNG